ncbi:MAG: tRNA (N6-isopentenyl adenosine(37)-C2)-methylthiotransferase MiaB [Clostridia bacterium]|nr:tRNA (N6-isopentenyl adenosine(37)-C2)-methylthiotransferase MiaB [Clostridia bacterium]
MQIGNYYIFTYGCQMNVHESEKLAGILEERGYVHCEKPEDADVLVYNTCCIREGAEQRAVGNIGNAKPIKKKNPNLIVAVCGCMTQQKNVANNLKKKFPFINIVFGANNVEFFGEYLDLFLKQRKYQNKILEDKNYQSNTRSVNIVRDDKYSAYVNITYGCNNFCTYCIVPYVRGREISRPAEEIYKEVKDLIEIGHYKIITLLGQNVNSYGNDLKDNKVTFPKLLEHIANFDGDFEIRFMSSHPKDLSDELIDVIARNKKISKAIHLPVQSGSNNVLKLMNRNYTREKYLDIIKKMKEKIPNLSLSTDIIVGFVGETEQDFQDTVNLIKEVKFSNAYIFMYSKRKGTVAEKMEGHLPLEVKRERIHKLLEIQKEITNNHFVNLIGTIQENVFVEDEKQTFYLGKTQCGKVVKIKKDKQLDSGSFYSVKITDYSGGNLYGEAL